MGAPSHDEADAAWDAFAAREPYYAVLTAEKFRRANLSNEHHREFFESGDQHVSWMLKVIDDVLEPGFSPVTILEFGCGVGRLAIPLARRPGRITAVDRSPAMLAAARLEAARQGQEHIDWQLLGEFRKSQRRFELVNCYGVLQRLSRADGLALLQELVRRIAPGGIGVFHIPFERRISRSHRVLDWARPTVPGVNAVVNRLRGRRRNDPFIPTTAYDLRDAIEAVDRAWRDAYGMHLHQTLIQVERQPELTSAIAFVQAPSLETQQRSLAPAERGAPIDVKDVIASTPLEALLESAEEYFASLQSWDYYVAKPFSSADAAPGLLHDLAQVIRCLEVAPGLRVLDFGSGTGWVSRCLTQLGCRTVLLDVSPTALRIAQELYARYPVVGEHPSPEYLRFDGRRIPLPDASVDRVVCFHSFHHVPEPDAMLREFARVLVSGGRAVFAEPGPRHSEHASSQFEMRTHRVVENDVDIHRIWRDAQACGFTDIRLVVGHEPLFQVSLDEFEEFLAAGRPAAKWLDSTRDYLRASRTFMLFRGQQADSDSTSSTGLSCRLTIVGPATIIAGQESGWDVTVENTGSATWLPAEALHGGVLVGAHLYDSEGRLLQFDFGSQGVADPVRPGGQVNVRLRFPPLPAGNYLVEVDCVARQVGWFSQWGSTARQVRLEVREEP